jgi:mono/diheme cytochrome c family protein
MERSLILALLTVLGALNAFADDAAINRGKSVYAIYCAPCHGIEGAGLVGPNLTDEEILHGETIEEIVKTITLGVPAKAMPSWASVLTSAQIADSAQFVRSIMGQNLPGPARGDESTMTSFPVGSPTLPYVLRTFMPALDLEPDVFPHHGHGRSTFKYSPKVGTFDEKKIQHPINGVPGAIAVNFGPSLSYCFDTTECRLLYTWTGPFVDMTSYWGEGSGGARKSFDYIARVIGDISFQAAGAPPLAGTPQFRGYRKVQGIPEFLYRIGQIDFTLRIEPGATVQTVALHYTSTGATDGLTLRFDPREALHLKSSVGKFSRGQLRLNATQAAAFTLTLATDI